MLRLHASKYSKIDPQFANIVCRQFYVDDLTRSVPTKKDGAKLYKRVQLEYLDGSFKVRKCRTNDNELQEFINSQEKLDVLPKNREIQRREIQRREIQRRDDKILGIIWRVDVDELVMDVYVNRCEKLIPTKRNILQVVAGIYNPRGFMTHGDL